MAKKKSDRKNKNFGDAVGISNIISSRQADYILGGIFSKPVVPTKVSSNICALGNGSTRSGLLKTPVEVSVQSCRISSLQRISDTLHSSFLCSFCS